MVWALGAVVILGVGLPVGAWWVSRTVLARRMLQPAGGRGPAVDAADQWLIERHRLPALQRWKVRNVVMAGGEFRDPALRAAAHDLAGGVLRGELKVSRSGRIAAWILLSEGVFFGVLGLLVSVEQSILAGIVLIPSASSSW